MSPGRRWLLPLTAAQVADLAVAFEASGEAVPVRVSSDGGAADWREAARLAGRDVLVRMACESYLAEMENPPRGKAAGPLTAVALVLRLGGW